MTQLTRLPTLHVEDDQGEIDFWKYTFTRIGIPEHIQKQAKSLRGLGEVLINTQQFSIVLLDGKFPEEPGGSKEFNARNAYDRIRQAGYMGPIAVYSGEDKDLLNKNLEGTDVTIFQKGGLEIDKLQQFIKDKLTVV